ncbi:MAG: hypothetical protein KC910_10130 [Candidatus Eremiobacteraeota bacterium]|nr:hypothetical protein [Candidatus Eremiobacteraeota bacterium]
MARLASPPVFKAYRDLFVKEPAGRPCPLFLRPTDRQRLERYCLALSRQLVSLSEEYFAGQHSQTLALDPETERLLKLDAAWADPRGCWRFDLFYWPLGSSGRGRVVLRYIDGEDGVLLHAVDSTVAELEETAAMKTLHQRFELSNDELGDGHRRALKNRHRQFFEDAGEASLAFCTPREAAVRGAHEALAEILRGRGWAAQVGDPEQFEYRQGALWLDEEKVDLVDGDGLDGLKQEGGRQILAAYLDGKACLANSLCSSLAAAPGVLELLSSSELPEELAGSVPWTRRVTGQTMGESLKEQKTLILKSSAGLMQGAETSRKRWKEALELAVDQPGEFVQSAQTGPTERFPHFDDKGAFLGFEPDSVGLSCWVYNGKFVGCCARVGSQESLAPVYFA